MSPDELATTTPAAQPKGARRRLLWIAATLVLVLFVVVSLAPPFVSAFGRGYAEDWFNQRHQGRLEIGGLDLAWTGRQRVREARLFAPGDEPVVARLSVELPSLLTLALRGSRDLGRVSVRGSADLVADDDGSTNLQRALAPRLSAETATEPEGEPGEADSKARARELALDLQLETLTWQDASTRASGEPLAFEDVRATAGMAWDGTITAHSTLQLAGGSGDGLELDLEIAQAFADLDAQSPPRFDVSVKGVGMPVGVIDGVLGTGGLLLEALGDRSGFELRALGTTSEGRLSLELDSERAHAHVDASIAAGRLRLSPEGAVELGLRPRSELFARLTEAYLPAGVSLEGAPAGAPLTLRVHELELALDGLRGELDPVALLADARARLELELPPLRLRQLPGGARTEARELGLERLLVELSLSPETGLDLHASGALEDRARGGLDLGASHPAPGALLAALEGGELDSPVRIEGRVSGLAASWIDELAEQDGLVVDVLGETLDVELKGGYPQGDEGLELTLRSPQASLDLRGSLVQGALRSREGSELRVSSGLTPLYSERIVGGLLPVLVGLAKPPGAAPVGLSVEDFVLPLSGDLGRLSARITLDLNQVSYSVLPGLEGWLQALDGKGVGARVVELEPITLTVREGRVQYEQVGLELNGHPLKLSGSFELATRGIDLTTDVPLSALGKGVASELQKVRDYVPASTRVPLRLGGSWTSPRVSLGEGFLETVLDGAKDAALKKGLEGLLDRARGKD